jgi:hypothetical protein
VTDHVGDAELQCELLHVEEGDDGILLDVVTIGEVVDDDGEVLPAGWPATLCLAHPFGSATTLLDDLDQLVRSDVGCRIGVLERDGQRLLLAAGADDCLVVLVVAAG